MRLPSIKTIQRIPGVDATAAREIRGIMEQAAYSLTPKFNAALERIDAILPGSCGVERIDAGERSPSIRYCNMGDSYSATVMVVRGRFLVGDWGSLVETGDYV